jgi:molybdopterin-guanine dinucleotide biosynthesis protein A
VIPVGFVLAGGRSARMGRDKALVPWGGTDLLGHALARLRAVTPDVRILCGGERRYVDRGVPVEVDRVPDSGPLGGVLAALEAAAGRAGLFLAVDLPFVPAGLLFRLLELADASDAVVPVSPRGPEPLCAVYRPECLPAVRAGMATGDLRMNGFWPRVRLREVTPAELSAFGDPSLLFLNLNTPEDLRAASGVSEP